jgi:hypothetical protein
MREILIGLSIAAALGTIALAVPDSPSAQPSTQPADPSIELARKIHAAHGGDLWHTVKRIKFTFNVEAEGKIVLSRSHDWDIRAGTDAVTTEGNTVIVDLYRERGSKPYQAWTNDSYWLLMPLKLLDHGVVLSPLITTMDHPTSRGTMTLSFEQVGLTPGDQYDLAIDMKNARIDHWVYRPNADKAVGFTWEDYKDFNGLILSTNHKSDDGKLRIFFTDVSVERD